MPNGYTAGVIDGTITDLRTFAFQCARGMGALVMMRDDPSDAPVPEHFEPSPFYKNELDKAQAALADLRAMTPDQWQAAADEMIAARVAARDRHRAARVVERDRYDAMIAKVQAFENAPEGLKAFMLKMLREGREFDCPERDDEWWYESLDPMSGEDWKVAQEARLMEQSARAAQEWQKEQDRTEGRNAWLAQLRHALDAAQPTVPA